MKSPFDPYRDRELSLSELATAAADLAGKLGYQPKSRRVGRIGERTVRFYQARELLDPPDRGASGGRGVTYNYLHLLQVVTLRRLQTQGYALEKIKRLIDAGKLRWDSPEELESAIDADADAMVSMDRRRRHTAELHLASPMAAAPPHDETLHRIERIESMLEMLLRRTEERGGPHIAREVRPGVNVRIDPNQVTDAEEVLGRIEEAVSDDD